MNKEDTKRLEELKLIVYGLVAINFLEPEGADPYVICSEKVERHGGRINKATRLLLDAGVWRLHHKGTQKYGSGDYHYKVLTFDKDSLGYGNIPDFVSTMDDLHDPLFNSDKDSNGATLGYRAVRSSSYSITSALSNAEAIYVYWNREAYIITNENGVYPKALEDTRQKAILRSIVEHDVTEQYTRRLEKYLGLSAETLKDNILFGVSVRNFAANPVFMQPTYLSGNNSLEQEYLHNMKYFQAVHAYYQKMLQLIQESGGPDALIKRMRMEAIEEIRFNAPRWLTAKAPEDWRHQSISSDQAKKGMDVVTKNKLARLLLDYGNFFNYDTLYAEDTSLKFIKDGKIALGKAWHEEVMFQPNPEELNFIQGYEHPATEDTSTMSHYELARIKLERECLAA